MPPRKRVLPPPESVVSKKPDSDTKKGIEKANDYTGQQADERVLFINLGIFKYGTSDKAHAAAVALSSVLLLTIIGLIVFGSGMEHEWRDDVFKWATGAFLFTSGIALGQRGGTKKKTKNGGEYEDDGP
jgi:hypothetical protein